MLNMCHKNLFFIAFYVKDVNKIVTYNQKLKISLTKRSLT